MIFLRNFVRFFEIERKPVAYLREVSLVDDEFFGTGRTSNDKLKVELDVDIILATDANFHFGLIERRLYKAEKLLLKKCIV